VGALLRFVPYIGAPLSAALPLALAAAIDPGWAPFLWTAALFLIVELVLSQMVEPLLYGHSTGLSPISVVIAATLWTWLGGPIGLILSTPITLCLVVLGRHVERLHFLDIALGDRPALTPAESFYQRVLAGAPHEARDQAKEILKKGPLSAYCDEVVIEGMRLAASDFARGALDAERLERVRETLDTHVEQLEPLEDVDLSDREPNGPDARASADTAKAAGQRQKSTPPLAPPDSRATVLCIAGRGILDRTVATIASQLLAKHGLGVRVAPYVAGSRSRVETLDVEGVSVICVLFLEVREKARHLRETLQRLRRHAPGVALLAGLAGSDRPAAEDEELRSAIGADYVSRSLRHTLQLCEEITLCASKPAPERSPPAAAARPRRSAMGEPVESVSRS
jgi:hypothetical protein